MFDDPSGVGVAPAPSPLLVSGLCPAFLASLSRYQSEMKKSACRRVCAPLPSSATN